MRRQDFEQLGDLFSTFFNTSILDTIREGQYGVHAVKHHDFGDELVGELDKKLEQRYFTFFDEHFPNDHVVSEETKHEWPPPHDKFWIIDPCDGTHNMLSGNPCFGTVAARVENGIVAFCAIFLPHDRTFGESGCYIAGRDCGSWRWNSNGDNHRLHVSETHSLEKSFLLIEGPSKRVLASSCARLLMQRARFFRKISATSWSGVLVASGGEYPSGCSGLICFESSPWDTLPVALLIREAGGTISDFQGAPLTVRNYANLVMSNGQIHDQILSEILKPTIS
ncbi:inositol monophosphatase family protein [Candidatus Uhrbacteria bacterium]|nr:inositol monophosphatase family protein [Candidatus Uhrbacteria bacterium]